MPSQPGQKGNAALVSNCDLSKWSTQRRLDTLALTGIAPLAALAKVMHTAINFMHQSLQSQGDFISRAQACTRPIARLPSNGGQGNRQEDCTDIWLTENLPRLGLSLPASTLMAVDLPMPLVPTSPNTCPGRGIGNLAGNKLGCSKPWPAASHAARQDTAPSDPLLVQPAKSLPMRPEKVYLCSLKEFAPYLCVVSFSRFLGRLMIMMASNGHFCSRHSASLAHC